MNYQCFLSKVYVLFLLLLNIDASEYGDSNTEYCLCVPFWQCKADFSGLDDNGLAVDVRHMREKTLNNPSTTSCTGDYDVCCEAKCGKKGNTVASSENKETVQERILGEAVTTEFAEFPWMLGILKGLFYRCGASLIHPKVALTAAHCVLAPAEYTVRAGEWYWERENEPLPHQDRTAEEIFIHPDYHPPSLQHDIALILLDAPFKLMRNVGIICLPPKTPKVILSQCIVTGWGKNSIQKGSYQPVLKKATIPMVSRSRCAEALRGTRLGPGFTLHDSFICAGGLLYDACKGDGGGPLICPVEGNEERYQQIGIVSWGIRCGMSKAPGVYVNILMFLDWIDTKMRELKLHTDIYKN
ncbi:phenoloxidase-activating factor 2-like [Sitophilus oryzae]|uniref:Phenoloxidase-activating factor 2 n=1 Tax=Sitophilus oryzae TaxID=7048 RepID=A0A6J2XLK1_SITOR|nr:phenoloxidase-activating factor 2-like [Sitophilus oryzae]